MRQAVAMSINRPELVRWRGQDVSREAQSVVPRGYLSFTADNGLLGPNIPKAKQLLAEAGYPHGFIMHILDVKALGFDTLAQAISGELAAVGITAIPVDASNPGDYFGKLASGRYETSILGFGGLPGYFLYGLLFGPGATQFNPLKTRSSVLDSAYQSLLPLSAAQATQYSQEMVSYVTNQAWFAIAVSTPFVAFGVKGIDGSQAQTNGRREWYLPELHPAA